MSTDDIELARTGSSTDPRRAAVARFVQRVIETRGQVGDADIAAVRTAGYSDAEILAIVTIAVVVLLTNYLNNVNQTVVDVPAVAGQRSDVPGSEIYERFLALHTREGGLVMPNAWDGLSAQLFADSGFEAIATSSVALAASLGRLDGRHQVTRDEHLAHAGLLAGLTGLPVNGDFEDGYGDAPELRRNVRVQSLAVAATVGL